MTRISIISSIMFCMALGLVAIDHLAPNWTKKVGLDFWNVHDLADHLKDEDSRGKCLEYVREQHSMRREGLDRISLELCEYRISLDEAIELMVPIAQSDPEWYAHVRFAYKVLGVDVSSDRDALTYYLCIKIQSWIDTAKALGDEIRAAAITKRLALLEIEIQEQKNLPARSLPPIAH